jgi:hypothetical protein
MAADQTAFEAAQEEAMKVRRLSPTETLGYCHDCHNRAHLEVTFAHRPPIRLCDRCARFLINDLSALIKRNDKNGTKSKPPAGG